MASANSPTLQRASSILNAAERLCSRENCKETDWNMHNPYSEQGGLPHCNEITTFGYVSTAPWLSSPTAATIGTSPEGRPAGTVRLIWKRPEPDKTSPEKSGSAFSQPVTNPAFAIWSLCTAGKTCSFNFTAAEPFNLISGGPNSEFGGQSIVVAGSTISGSEANGVVQFIGTYSSLTFTTPIFENYYVFTVGEDQTLTDSRLTSSILNQVVTSPTVVFGTMTFSPAAAETYGTNQPITISDTLTYSGAQPTGTVTYVLHGVSYTATCTATGSPETCSATVPAATIAALPVAVYTVTGSLAADSSYAAATAASGTFTISLPLTVAAPVFSPVAGTYASAQVVSISDATPGATIYYTTNGAVPTTSSTMYGGPVVVSSTETLKAIAAVTAGAVVVSLGYYDLAPCCGNANPLPNPWVGGPNTTFLGDTSLATSSDPDESAILFTNTGAAAVTLNPGVKVTSGSNVEQLWDGLIGPTGISIAAGASVILSSTNGDNFDGSEIPLARSTISFSINGVIYSAVDTNCFGCVSNSVLNGSINGAADETVPWTQVANIGGTSVIGAVSSATYIITQTPTITFAVPNHTYGDPPFAVSASSNSTGTFTYSVVSGPATISGNTVTLTGAGTVTLNASEAADPNYTAGSQTATFTVAKATSSFGAMAFSPAATEPFGTGQVITISDTLTYPGIPPTGTVTYILNGVSYAATCAPAGSPETCSATVSAATISALPIAAYTVKGSFAGDNNYAAATAASGTFTITSVSTNTTLTSSATSLSLGQTLTLTATVSAATGGTPAGTVTFYNGATSLGVATLNAGGVASLTLTPALGADSITTGYSGSSSDSASTSSPALTVVVTLPSTTATLSTSATTLVNGQSLTLTATVAGTGKTTPTGIVTFGNGAATLGTGTVNGSGIATLTLTPAIGSHSITASYPGDSSNASSTSSAVVVNVIAIGSTNLSLGASATTLTYGQTLTLAGTAISTIPTHPPSGNISFTSGAATLGATALNGTGIATYSFVPTVGIYVIGASYAGDSFNSAATAAPLSITVNPVPTILTLTSNLNPAPPGSTITFTVSAQSSAGVPPGSVTLMDGATLLASLPLNAVGTATYSTSTLVIGTHNLTVSLAANGNFAASQAALSQIVVPPPTFSITASGPLTLVTQHHGPITITVTPLYGFSGNVTLNCGTLPPFARCEWGDALLTSTSVSVSGSPASTQLTIETSAVLDYQSSTRPAGAGRTRIALAGLTFPLLCLIYRRRKGAVRLALCVIAGLSVLSLSGCDIKYPGSTPPGTYSITISGASGTTQNSGVLTLIVTN